MSIEIDQELLLNNSKYYLPNSDKTSGSISVVKEYGNLKYDYFTNGKDLAVNIVQFHFKEDIKIKPLETDENHSFLSFNLGNKLLMKEGQKELTFDKNMCCHGTSIGNNSGEGLYSKNKDYLSFNLMLSNELYESLFEQNPENLIYQSDSFSMNFHNRLNAKQNVLIKSLMNSPFGDKMLNQIYLESKALELLHVSASLKDKKDDIYLSQKDVECLHKAKDILLSDIQNPPSLGVLARKSALNEYKLKKGFKHIFNNTVYGFLQVYRLEVAKNLLQTGDINISEASEIVGYKNPSYFSKLFYKYYGEMPKEVKKSYGKTML